ncbi:hypothetical protein SAMN04489743_0472 [Pseudarthrobacter equi]|uniref:Uncharacterized protein n=1 Tax=Pseudarthrobacter equi TaxID=728066 RepID=A0A1H1TQ14_9MICC|nr:hypothetical protein [Pseudarthrobacter equi]SDS62373.1 hypothetical protein SAMN04489743_0472 [Pseudarthrobacter equi]
MDNTKRATLIWSLGAVVFSLIGVYIALTANGVWYSIVSAVILLLAGCAFASRAVLALRAQRPSS